nr:MAG TPA: hypothetical protein [Caudoviricetes sp.]
MTLNYKIRLIFRLSLKENTDYNFINLLSFFYTCVMMTV